MFLNEPAFAHNIRLNLVVFDLVSGEATLPNTNSWQVLAVKLS
ncbi:MAG: hypothetical protein ACI9HY_001602 [Planctomycetaceae bacterium]|jgi:hypothetical protein